MKLHPLIFKIMVFLGGFCTGSAWGTTIYGVEMQPGEWTKTIPGIPVPTGQYLYVEVKLPGVVCFVDASRIRAGVRNAASDGSLATKLTQLEGQPTSSFGTAAALRVYSPGSGNVVGYEPIMGTGARTIRFSSADPNSAWSREQAATLRPNDSDFGRVRDCLTLSDAQALVLRLREVIRRYLGMPPPSVPLQGLSVPLQGLPPPQR